MKCPTQTRAVTGEALELLYLHTGVGVCIYKNVCVSLCVHIFVCVCVCSAQNTSLCIHICMRSLSEGVCVHIKHDL